MVRWLRIIEGCAYLAKTVMDVLFKTGTTYRFILIGSPLHGNLGDHAISIAERQMLFEHFKQNPVIEISGRDFKILRKFLSRFVSKKDIVLISGGGFLGNLWLNEEEMVRQVILSFPQNSIYILPQTVFYSKDEAGQNELKKSKDIYSNHKKLHMFLRENNSLEFVRKNFETLYYVECVPDMVLYLDFSKPDLKRSNILFCFREDKEKRLNQEALADIHMYFRGKGFRTIHTSTVLDRGIPFRCRNEILNEKLAEFKTSRLVITDRLHGMLFAAVTATPCIAFDNLSGKVRGVYEWISDLEYIKFAQTPADIVEYSEELLNMEICKYDNTAFRQKLFLIVEELKRSKQE